MLNFLKISFLKKKKPLKQRFQDGRSTGSSLQSILAVMKKTAMKMPIRSQKMKQSKIDQINELNSLNNPISPKEWIDLRTS